MANLTDLQTRQTEIRSRLAEIDKEADGERFTADQSAEWNNLNEELEGNREHIEELEARQKRVEELTIAGSVEPEPMRSYNRAATKKIVPDDLSDITAYRQHAGNIDELHDGYREGALRLVERMVPVGNKVDREGTQERLDTLLRTVDSPSDRALAQRIIKTSSPLYERAWAKYIQHGRDGLSPDESRALSLTSSAGGYAVPYTLDPTVILVSTGYKNPVRDLARNITITGNNWIGITSTGVTASYGAEVTETSDNAPTLVQPSANVEKAQAFIPMSIEITQDWGAVQAEMGALFADAKNVLENTQFLTGLGHSSNAPQGLIAVGGATAVVSTATSATFAVADLYSLEAALNVRFRDNATIVGNNAAFQKIRQFDTAGGANLWTQLSYNEPATLLGYPVREWSAFSSALTTSGSTILTFGDFSKFLIIDRVGMDVELIPHLFATANNRPSGQRGLYAYWRNTSYVATPGLQANSGFVSLKLL